MRASDACGRGLPGLIGAPGPADGQHGVALARVLEARGDDARDVPLADRLAGGELPVAEHHERLALLHVLHLPAQRLEERGRSHDRVVEPRARERLLEGQLGPLELQPGLLHADGREQHEVPGPGALGRLQHVEVGLVLDAPRVLGSAGPGGEAGDGGIEAVVAIPEPLRGSCNLSSASDSVPRNT